MKNMWLKSGQHFRLNIRRRTQRGKGKARGFILDTVQDNGKQFVSRLMLISTKSPLKKGKGKVTLFNEGNT